MKCVSMERNRREERTEDERNARAVCELSEGGIWRVRNIAIAKWSTGMTYAVCTRAWHTSTSSVAEF